MMSKVCDTIIFFPPPPPPLPDLSGILSVKTPAAVTEEPEKEIVSNITLLYRNLVPDSETFPSTFKYSHLNPLIQDGPTCGLVALSMISSSTSCVCEVSDLFDLALRRGFTKKGEMFSALNMTNLAKEVLSEYFEVTHHQGGIMEKREEVMQNLLSGNLYLIPYDADKNHTPANLRGFKAHWAILCGVLMDSTNCFVLGRQSKSKHVALWDFDSLHFSNMNLVEIAIDKSESTEYVVDDIKSTLAGNYILFNKR